MKKILISAVACFFLSVSCEEKKEEDFGIRDFNRKMDSLDRADKRDADKNRAKYELAVAKMKQGFKREAAEKYADSVVKSIVK